MKLTSYLPKFSQGGGGGVGRQIVYNKFLFYYYESCKIFKEPIAWVEVHNMFIQHVDLSIKDINWLGY